MQIFHVITSLLICISNSAGRSYVETGTTLKIWESLREYSEILTKSGLTMTQQTADDFVRLMRKFHRIQESLAADGLMNGILSGKYDPDVFRNASQLITSKGYVCEEHTVVTEDGYILGLQRIPHGRRSHNRSGPRRVAFLQHGLLASATNFLANSANDSLGFMLADNGFDVWLGNVRGNTYSRKHKYLNPDKDHAFWNFTWDDMASKDLPAMLDYVLKVTNQTQLVYIGHSQGTMMGFAEFNRNKELAEKVHTFVALAPVANISNMISPIKDILPFAHELKVIYELFGTGEFFSSSKLIKWFVRTACREPWVELCEDFIFLLAGFDFSRLNTTRIPVYLSHTPAGTSVKNMVHYAQAVKLRQFQMYDYGMEGNMKIYHQITPPIYNVSTMKTPVVLYSGGKDWLADPTDVKRLIPQLKNVVRNRFIPSYNHLDFIWAIDANRMVYDDLINFLKRSLLH
ncbi:gastric triacylglycerol lipase-like [Tubulanus polymorphus]|uniref:gastric triacylglycerol lipase-like n=1 Tax=Tubulanus polymorphus TaxID=672921 RepID=UPI003DA3D00C